MSKSKSPAVIPSFDVHITHIRNYHRLAMNSAAQTACAAAMAGLELQKVKRDLKKTASRCSFEEWLSQNQSDIGFSPRTGFKYCALAENLKGKLLKEEERSVAGLLDKAPSELSDPQMKRLLQAMHKSIDGQTLSELYTEYEITRAPHKLRNPDPSNNGSGKEPPPVTIEERIHLQLELFAQSEIKLDEMVEYGGKKVYVISLAAKKEFDQAFEMAKRRFQMMVKIKKARETRK